MGKRIVVNQERCLACKQCMIECAMAHCEAASLVEAINSDNPPQSRVHVEPLGEFGMPLQCRHCEDAPCITVCPTDAITRLEEGGPVLLDADRCIGCQFCLMVCPFGVIGMSRSGKATIKCDLCIERTSAGEEPACVSACPTGALEFVNVDEWLARRRRQAARQIADATRLGEEPGAERQDGSQ